jgi:hypothetical protein
MERKRPEKYKEKLSLYDKTILKVLLQYGSLAGRGIAEKFQCVDKKKFADKNKKTIRDNIVRRKGVKDNVGNLMVLENDEFIRQNEPGVYSLTEYKGVCTAIKLCYEESLLTPEIESFIAEKFALNDSFQDYSKLYYSYITPEEKIQHIIKTTNDIISDTANFYKMTNDSFKNSIIARTFFKYNQHYDMYKIVQEAKETRESVFFDMSQLYE